MHLQDKNSHRFPHCRKICMCVQDRNSHRFPHYRKIGMLVQDKFPIGFHTAEKIYKHVQVKNSLRFLHYRHICIHIQPPIFGLLYHWPWVRGSLRLFRLHCLLTISAKLLLPQYRQIYRLRGGLLRKTKLVNKCQEEAYVSFLFLYFIINHV